MECLGEEGGDGDADLLDGESEQERKPVPVIHELGGEEGGEQFGNKNAGREVEKDARPTAVSHVSSEQYPG